MNLINWIRRPTLLWSFSTKKVGWGDLFYAPSREQVQATILYQMRMMFGDDLEELRWEREEEYNADVLVEYSEGGKYPANYGYLKLVNDEITTIEEVMENHVQLTDAEKEMKQKRIDKYMKQLGLRPGASEIFDPEGYYGYGPIDRNPDTYEE